MDEAHGQRVRALEEFKARTDIVDVNDWTPVNEIHARALRGKWLRLSTGGSGFAKIAKNKITRNRIVSLWIRWHASPEQLVIISKFPNLKYLECDDNVDLTPVFSNPDCPIL